MSPFKKRPSNSAASSSLDSRFASASWDPRFGRVPKRAKKAIQDDRFEQQLKSNPGFRPSRTPIDRFGRPKQAPQLDRSLKEVLAEEESDDDDDDDDDEIDEAAQVLAVGKEAGEMEESSDEDSEMDELVDGEGEQVEEIPRGKATRRLAVVGLDWSMTRAVDIYASLSCFCPAGKRVDFVEVHPSKFGLERLAVEAKFGPQVVEKTDLRVVEEARKSDLIPEKDGEDENESGDEDDEENNSDDDDMDTRKWKSQKALRKYEEERLKYYYAIAQFEDVKSADAVYEQCDGVEYSQSGRSFDLRFIPEDMVINTTPRDRADKVPDRYKPPHVTPSSLNNSNVKLSWDVDDPDRMILKKKAMGKHELDEENLKAYLAGSSDEEEKPSETEMENKKNLLLVAIEENEPEEEEMEMEVSFEPGMLEKGEEIVKRKEEQEERKDESAWESRLRRQEERKAEKRKKRREFLAAQTAKKKDGDDWEEKVDDAFENATFGSDPFFSVDRNADGARADDEIEAQLKDKGKKKRDKGRRNEEDAEKAAERKREEDKLTALLKSDEPSSGPLTLRQKLAAADSDSDEDEGRRKKRTRGKRRAQKKKVEGLPSVDTKDPRFERLFESHLYAMDPTHPKFRGDESSKSILHEQAARASELNEGSKKQAMKKKTGNKESGGAEKSEAMQLVERIKAKAAAKRKAKSKV